MNPQTNDDLKNFLLKAAEENKFTPRFDYSGRYMNGKTCFGIVGNMSNLAKFICDVTIAICESNDKELTDQDIGYYFNDMQIDQMGKSDNIIYWKNLHISPN